MDSQAKRSSDIHRALHELETLLGATQKDSPLFNIFTNAVETLRNEEAGLDCQMMWVCSKCCPSGVTVE